MSESYEVAAYYFPQWHPDRQNEQRYGEGWSEWRSLRVAIPRFEGHEQPKTPAWGELDESDPIVSEKQINAAADHGITCFLYDWYWDMGSKGEGPYLERALEEGYLQAPNKERLDFALMWANHNKVNRERFDKMVEYIIATYFHYSNHWTIDGKLYFSIYEMHTLIQGLGGLEETRAALRYFRDKVAEAGYPGLHLNAMEWGVQQGNLNEFGISPNDLISFMGMDSVTSYVWIHNVTPPGFPNASYSECVDLAEQLWPELRERFSVPYYPNATMGWDPSPRTDQTKELVEGAYPNTAILEGNTPAEFKRSLELSKKFLDEGNTHPRIVTLYAWNEWTEGGYLEPDTIHGMGYLEAIRDVFGAGK